MKNHLHERKRRLNIGTFVKKYHLCSIENWIEQVTILDLLVKGFIVGVVVSAPLGLSACFCISEVNKGRWFGFVTGLGAALSDICYALITGDGMSFMDNLL